MKGNRSGAGRKVTLMSLFASAFIAGALVTFAITAASGALIGITRAPERWRLGAAAAILAMLALIDVIAARGASYCPLGWRRQTSQAFGYDHSAPAVVALWGFDTGLAVTTFRVAALTWGALILTVLGFASWRTGFAYGIGFVVPLLTLMLLTPRVERYVALLRARSGVQLISALLLGGSAVFLLMRVFS